MPKEKKALKRLIKLLNRKSVSVGEICRTLKVNRKTVYDIIKEATERRWIEKNSMGNYRLTLLGKTNIGTAEDPTGSVSLEAQSQIIDLLELRSERPTAKCTIEIQNADKIKKLDSQTEAVKRFLTHDGLWLPENNTNLKASIAAVVDSILDLKAKEMGLFNMLDEEYRNNLTPFNIHTYFSGYDAIKRYEDLAKTKFSILIEFDGEKWVSKQDFEDLEKRIDKNREHFSENVHLMDERVRLNKTVYNLLSGGELSSAKLHANHLFNNPAELKEYLTNHFKINQITNKNQLNTMLKNGFDNGFFSVERMTLHHLRVRKDKELQFLKSLPFLNSITLRQMQQDKTGDIDNNQVFTAVISTDNIISAVYGELESFEKVFINQLAKTTEKFNVANLSDALQSTSTKQLASVRRSLSELISIFHEVISTYTYRGMILWPVRIRDKKILNKVHSILFSKITNMRALISQRLSHFYGGTFDKMFEDYFTSGIYRTQSLLNHIEIFKNSNMEKESEELINNFWNIHRECCQQAFPEALIYGWVFDYNKDGWKKFLHLQAIYPDQTYKNYIQRSDGKI